MFRRNDPRFRRTLNQLSQNIESANETAQAGLFDFNQRYLVPCFASLGECLNSCAEPCFGSREEQLRRQRRLTRGRAELSFDFYDDWEEDEEGGLLGWNNNDELDRLLAGTGAANRHKRRADEQPGRNRAMSYGTRRDPRGRRKSVVVNDDGTDPTIIPQSSLLGFLERFKLGGSKGLKYKPSAADLTERPGRMEGQGVEAEPLIDEDEDAEMIIGKRHKRNRSNTGASGHTTDSLSSRGDIFPSEDELDDAQLMDDEFAMELGRRDTGMDSNEASSGKTRSSKRPSASRLSTRTMSSKDTKEEQRAIASTEAVPEEPTEDLPTLADLKQEEEQIRDEEEAEVERKREAARHKALSRGLSTDTPPKINSKGEFGPEDALQSTDLQSPAPVAGDEAFPSFDADAQPAVNEPASPSPRPSGISSPNKSFVPAKLPNFNQNPD